MLWRLFSPSEQLLSSRAASSDSSVLLLVVLLQSELWVEQRSSAGPLDSDVSSSMDASESEPKEPDWTE